MAALKDHVLDHGQARVPQSFLVMVLSIETADGEHTSADVGKFGEFQETLDGAVFAKCAMKHGENDVDAGVTAGFRRESMRLPFSILADEELGNLIFRLI